MDYKKLAADLLSGCEENCANCEYAGDSEFECTISRLSSTAITELLARADAAEARVRELETSFRTEKCENGPECVELGRARKALAAAEARAEKAERKRDAAVADLRLVSDCRTCGNVSPWCIENPDKCKGWEWRDRKEE